VLRRRVLCDAACAIPGYTPGQGLGKRGDGITEPVAVTQRAPRSGLGTEEAVLEKRRRVQEAERASAAQQLEHERTRAGDFRARSSAAHAQRELVRRHGAALAALEALDRRLGVTASALWARVQEEEEDAPSSAELAAQLAAAHTRLREVHHYCAYCGAQYASADELAAACPGELEQDHE
jgi:hypothetical protein